MTMLLAPRSGADGETLPREPEQVPGIHLAIGEGPRRREQGEERVGPGRLRSGQGIHEEVLHGRVLPGRKRVGGGERREGARVGVEAGDHAVEALGG